MAQAEEQGRSLDYMPRLDGLRAIAVLAVLVEHFSPVYVLQAFSPGGAGVTLFFVLSGYLITRILINYTRQQASISSVALQFYWRRLLRLSPPYYVAIALAALLGLPQVRDNWWVHALYLTNLKIGLSGVWSGGADHFWSLCVEEQFYLLWFLVVVALPRRWLVPAVLASFTATLVFRSTVYLQGWSAASTVLLPGNLVSLAMGALLAQAEKDPRLSIVVLAALSRRVLLLAGSAFALVSLSLPFIDFPRAILYPFSGALFFACVVFSAAQPGTNAWFDWLKHPTLAQIGKMSYGIFVYHMFLPQIFKMQPLLGRIFDHSTWRGFFLVSAASIGVAWVSWTLMEKPLLRYKDRLPWTGLGRTPVPGRQR